MTREAYICDAVRTPIGRYAGALAKVRADDLATIPIRALVSHHASATTSRNISNLRLLFRIQTASGPTPNKVWCISNPRP